MGCSRDCDRGEGVDGSGAAGGGESVGGREEGVASGRRCGGNCSKFRLDEPERVYCVWPEAVDPAVRERSSEREQRVGVGRAGLM